MDSELLSILLSLIHPIPIDQLGIRLYQVEIDGLIAHFLPLLTSILSQEDWRAINLLSPAKMRQRLILSRGLLRVLLGNYLQIKPPEIQLASNRWGKLYLPGHALQFNLAHSGSRWVLALSETHGVGVDVEQIRPLECLQRLVQRYSTLAEQIHWQTLLPAAQARYFLELWVAKEAYAKALGTGLTGMLRQFAHLHTWGETQIAPAGGWPAHLRRFSLGTDYVGAVCWGVTPGADASIPAQIQSVDHSRPQFP